MPCKRTIWPILMIVAAGLLISVLLPFRVTLSGPTQKRIIDEKVAGADNVIIDSNTKQGENGSIAPFGGRHVPTTRVADPDAVRKLLDGLEFEQAFDRSHCMCYGEVALRFCQGDRELLALTLHHGQSLRILDSNWARNANMPLTAASRTLVSAWLASHGYRSPVANDTDPRLPGR